MSPLAPPAGPHGGDGVRLAASSASIPPTCSTCRPASTPVAPDPLPIVAVPPRRAAPSYPDPGRASAALAQAMGVDPLLLVLTNGGAEAIALVAAETRQGPGRRTRLLPLPAGISVMWIRSAPAGDRTPTTRPAFSPPRTSRPASGTRRSGRSPPAPGLAATPTLTGP